MATLRAIQARVPSDVRAASARALEYANPPAPLVRLFALDDLPVALPVLRSARLGSSEWIQLLPDLAPAARQVLRNRRDLGPVVKRALESFGSVDFVLPDESGSIATHDATRETGATARNVAAAKAPVELVDTSRAGEPTKARPPVALAAVAPVEPVSSRTEHVASRAGDMPGAVATAGDGAGAVMPGDGPFEIADVVARIDAFWRNREQAIAAGPPPMSLADHFRFETDVKGVIRWVDGISRAPVVGLSLDLQGAPGGSRVDGIAAGGFRRRAAFSDARMWIEGDSDASGDWLLSAIPAFDSTSGRFAGFRGTARRPRSDERAEPSRDPASLSPADSLRQLVHELRTPTNAIAGFAEMIEAQMLGPVPDPYRERASIIRSQARELLGAIDDLDLAARIDSAALALVPGRVALRPLLASIADDLAPLSELRGSILALPIDDLSVMGDRRAVERLLARLMATLVSASGAGERIGVHMRAEGNDKVAIAIDRPKALADYPGESVLGIDDEREDSTLLGTGFALRLARNLARELGGSLVIAPESLTLRLPAAETAPVGQAHLS